MIYLAAKYIYDVRIILKLTKIKKGKFPADFNQLYTIHLENVKKAEIFERHTTAMPVDVLSGPSLHRFYISIMFRQQCILNREADPSDSRTS